MFAKTILKNKRVLPEKVKLKIRVKETAPYSTRTDFIVHVYNPVKNIINVVQQYRIKTKLIIIINDNYRLYFLLFFYSISKSHNFYFTDYLSSLNNINYNEDVKDNDVC